MSTFDTPPVTCILCELANVSPAKILVAGVVFGQAFGVAGVMDKLRPVWLGMERHRKL